MKRATRDDFMNGTGISGHLFATIDMYRSPYFNLLLGLRGKAGSVENELSLYGANLSLGGRFQVR